MELFLTFLLASVALAAPEFQPIQLYYHETVGIPEAARIKAAEEAVDFDGARIVGGAAATSGQFPFLGGLVITLASGGTSVCGSTLLTTTRLVTAAHCWFDGRQTASQLTVVLGSLRLFYGGTRINTNQCEVHANYNPSNLNNDVAVIKINRVGLSRIVYPTIPVELLRNGTTDTVYHICITVVPYTIKTIPLASGSENYVGQTAQVAGFGRTRDGASITPDQILSHVSLPVISNAECQRIFGGIVRASTLCTSGANGRSTCVGDSGGPLRFGNTLIGIVSFGASAGCQRGYPVGFSRVTYFNSWINQRLR